jgi:ATP-dependent Clp protease ATP-binding subunit ClpA
VGHERAVARIVASLLAHERRRTNPRVFERLEQGARREARADLGAFAMVLAGPSGVGKTSMARAIHRLRSGPSGSEMLHISGASFPRPEYLSQLVGTTAGYVGYGQGGELVTALKRNPRLVVEIAEPELGCPALMHRVVLPMLDGEIVGNEGDRISTRGVCIFLTTNAGSVDRTPPVGFQPWGDERSVRDHEQRLDELRRVLPPRVLSRLGEERVVLLDPLSTAELREVARRLLGALEEREGVTLHVEARVLDALVEGCDGLDTLGVRALVRRVEELVEVPLMDLALTTPDLREALVLIESEGEVRVRAAETVSGKDESDETSR